MFDLVIRNGTVVDGTGKARFRADVAVQGGRIVEVGKVTGAARRTIDADGLLVTPGFVDIHTHYDGQVSWDSLLAPSSINGVTSIAMGNCGVGFAPARVDKHDWLISLLEGVEDIPGAALAEGLTWDWESFPDYMDALAKRSYAVDVGAQIPHAALRCFVMGERGANHEEHPTEGEIAEMARLTRQSLEAGALGFTTSRTFAHRTRDGANIGTLTAGQRELVGILGALKESGKGVIQLISDAYLTPDDTFADTEMSLIANMAKATGRPLSFSLQQTDDAPDRWRFILERVQAMVAGGLDVKAQVAPRPIGVIESFSTTVNPFFMTPAYRELLALPLEARLLKLAEPEVRARLIAQHREAHPGGLLEGLAHSFNRMHRLTDPADYEPSEDNSIAAEARRLGKEPVDHAYDVLLEEGGHRLLYMPLVNYARGHLGDVHGMMTAPNTLFGLSDGGAHCGTICDGSFPTTTLGLWSKGSKAGLSIPLEHLVHGYTQRNAAHVGWMDRGVVAPGMLADLNIIDLDQLSLSPPRVVQDLPAGGSRLLQTARGYRWTIKNGLVTFENGEHLGDLPGRLVRGTRAA